MSSPDLARVEKRGPNSREIRVSDDRDSLVYIKNKGVTDKRRGRGFSQKEISEAFMHIGLQNQNISKVRAFRIPVDNLRRTVYQENVNKLEKVLNGYFHSKKQRIKTNKTHVG